MDTESVGGLPRYVVAFLHHMGPYSDYLKWNIAEASHKITVTLTWNFHCPLAGNRRRGPAAKTAGLWGKLQRTLRLPRAPIDTVQHQQQSEGSVPREVTDFLRQTSDERAACLRQGGNRVAVRPRGWSDTLRDLRQKRRLRTSLSLPEKITGTGATGAFTPAAAADEYGSTSLRKDFKATSYPATPTRSQWSVHGNGRPPETLSSGKTISWPRFGDLWLVADSVGAIGAQNPRTVGHNDGRRERRSCTWPYNDNSPLEGTYRSKDGGGGGGLMMAHQQQQPAIFIHRASPETPSTDEDEQGQDEVTEAVRRSTEGRVGEGEARGSQPNNNQTVNQTVLKCLDSCDKILFRHSTTIT